LTTVVPDKWELNKTALDKRVNNYMTENTNFESNLTRSRATR